MRCYRFFRHSRIPVGTLWYSLVESPRRRPSRRRSRSARSTGSCRTDLLRTAVPEGRRILHPLAAGIRPPRPRRRLFAPRSRRCCASVRRTRKPDRTHPGRRPVSLRRRPFDPRCRTALPARSYSTAPRRRGRPRCPHTGYPLRRSLGATASGASTITSAPRMKAFGRSRRVPCAGGASFASESLFCLSFRSSRRHSISCERARTKHPICQGTEATALSASEVFEIQTRASLQMQRRRKLCHFGRRWNPPRSNTRRFRREVHENRMSVTKSGLGVHSSVRAPHGCVLPPLHKRTRAAVAVAARVPDVARSRCSPVRRSSRTCRARDGPRLARRSGRNHEPLPVAAGAMSKPPTSP